MKKILLISLVCSCVFIFWCRNNKTPNEVINETAEEKECRENSISIEKCEKYINDKKMEERDIEEAKKVIKDILKAPSTAVFYDLEWKNWASFNDLVNNWIKWNVDSQNSFGGMWRTRFVCNVKNHDENLNILSKLDIGCFYDDNPFYDSMLAIFEWM